MGIALMIGMLVTPYAETAFGHPGCLGETKRLGRGGVIGSLSTMAMNQNYVRTKKEYVLNICSMDLPNGQTHSDPVLTDLTTTNWDDHPRTKYPPDFTKDFANAFES